MNTNSSESFADSPAARIAWLESKLSKVPAQHRKSVAQIVADKAATELNSTSAAREAMIMIDKKIGCELPKLQTLRKAISEYRKSLSSQGLRGIIQEHYPTGNEARVVYEAIIQGTHLTGSELHMMIESIGITAPSTRVIRKWKKQGMFEVMDNNNPIERDDDFDLSLFEEEEENHLTILARDHTPKRKNVEALKAKFKGTEKRILIFDIETMPAVTHQYQLRDQFTSPKNVLKEGDIICYSSKWLGDPLNVVRHRAVWHEGGQDKMLDQLWSEIDEADYVIGHNSVRFDLPKVLGYFARKGMAAPSKARSIDTMSLASKLGYESKSLYYVARQLKTTLKVAGAGAAGWKECLGISDELDGWENVKRMTVSQINSTPLTPEMKEARRSMKVYCSGDVLATEDLFYETMEHSQVAIFDSGCPRCGGTTFRDAGHHETNASKWRRIRCEECLSFLRYGPGERRNGDDMIRPVL